MACLALFWKNDTGRAIEKLSAYISNSSDFEDVLPFYRLWIECLWTDKDLSGLVAMNEHLSMISEDKPFVEQYLALKGLIHLRMDEFEAADLIASSFDKFGSGSYMHEFISEFYQRTAI